MLHINSGMYLPAIKEKYEVISTNEALQKEIPFTTQSLQSAF